MLTHVVMVSPDMLRDKRPKCMNLHKSAVDRSKRLFGVVAKGKIVASEVI
jgi:hypothetical protein